MAQRYLENFSFLGSDEIKVLFVDDDREDFLLVKAMLKKSQQPKYSIEHAADYDEAYELIISGRYDICLVDYRLGARDGLELLGEVRAGGCTEPIIILTGQESSEVDLLALKAGASDYLTKNHLEPELLSRSIRYALQKGALMEELAFSARLSTLGEMTAAIAHEINNPLTIIVAKAEMLSDFVEKAIADPSQKEQALKASKGIVDTSKRIGRIIRAIRATSRGGHLDEVEPFSIRDMIHDATELCEERFRSHNVELHVNIADDVTVAGRITEISQVVLNILSNALAAVENRDVRWVRVDVNERNSAVEIAVSDSGGGVPEVLRPKIMKPFFTTKKNGRGTGLGLSISKQIVEAHRGELTLDAGSEHTRFVVKLPKVEHNASAVDKEIQPQ